MKLQFRDLKAQYAALKSEIDEAVNDVILNSNFISGKQVTELEEELAEYVGVKHCISCANGTDALVLAMMALKIGNGDAVFVPDFTFFASGEAVSFVHAVPIFVDVEKETFNLSCESLEYQINQTILQKKLIPKAIVVVDLFGLPANYPKIKRIADKYHLKIIEDSAQGFGGRIGDKLAGSFGDIGTTSFFPAKPLGCYGDGGAVFTDDDQLSAYIRSVCVHGKGSSKYDNVRIGMNSRLDTIQAAILQVKMKAFTAYELERVNLAAEYYNMKLEEFVTVPRIPEGYYSGWAQYTIILNDKRIRDGLQVYLNEENIPSMIYYIKPMHRQEAFDHTLYRDEEYINTNELCDRVLSLPLHPYITHEIQDIVIENIKNYLMEL